VPTSTKDQQPAIKTMRSRCLGNWLNMVIAPNARNLHMPVRQMPPVRRDSAAYLVAGVARYSKILPVLIR
jgi:hypothetical protein